MKKTPETNALLKQCKIKGRNPDPWKLCRKLEQERDEALEAGGITFLMAEKHALENELEAMTAKAVGWQNQAELNARLLVECREKAERYRLEANAMMAQRDEARRKVSELQAGLNDIEEYGTEEINAAAVGWRGGGGVKVLVLFEGHVGSPPDVLGVFETKEKLRQVMRAEFPKAKARNRKCPSELYWEDDDGFWFRAQKVAFFKEDTK